jgi:membrane protein implicated in regulation of membrane protease activity
MDVSAATGWWVAAGIAVAAELGTGTFYLLMIALGLAAGAVAAHLGLPLPAQMVTAAAVGAGATAFWYWRRRQRGSSDNASHQNRDVNLDIGERVHVAAWSADGTAQVRYRGSGWTARLAPGAPAAAGEHVVSAVEGNWLVLLPASSVRS